MVKCEVLEEGEEALVYHFNGKVKLQKGPKRIWLFSGKLKRLTKYTAHHDEYLIISHLDGKTEHRLGPCNEVLNTLKYSNIRVEKCYCLDANQAIIVYQKSDKNKHDDVAYRINIIHGPGIFMLQPNEWVHKFNWHGQDDNNKTKYIPNKNKFEILNCAPSQLYYNVDEVRTSDDALIRVKLMIFYEIKDIILMLNETKDPIADLINCCRADIISFTTKKTYLNFIESCHHLNNLMEYSKLIERSKKIGFEITKVVFRGYYASPKLQSMHDSSIQTRTELKLEFESEIQLQEQLDLKLKNEMARLTTEQELEYQKLISQQEIERLKLASGLSKLYEETKTKFELDKELKLKELEIIAKKNEQKLEHLEKLNQLDIDLTDYLISSLSIPDKHIKIFKNNQNSGEFSNIHLHE